MTDFYGKLKYLGSQTIASSGTDSAGLSAEVWKGCNAIIIACDESALTGTVTVQMLTTDGGSTYATLQSPAGTDVAIAAAKAIMLDVLAFPKIRLHSSGAEAGARVFQLWGVPTVVRN
jgi:hypothetical protein